MCLAVFELLCSLTSAVGVSASRGVYHCEGFNEDNGKSNFSFAASGFEALGKVCVGLLIQNPVCTPQIYWCPECLTKG